jgi:hypothetical protein
VVAAGFSLRVFEVVLITQMPVAKGTIKKGFSELTFFRGR